MEIEKFSNPALSKLIKSVGGIENLLASDFSYVQIINKNLACKWKRLEDDVEDIKLYLEVI